MKKTIKLTLLAIILLQYGCKKYLEINPDTSNTIPTTIQDAQAIIDKERNFNLLTELVFSSGITSSDELYLTNPQYDVFASYTNTVGPYTWIENFDNVNTNQTCWARPYLSVFDCNLALETLNKITPKSNEVGQYNNAKGDALYYRGHSFFTIAAFYTKAYNEATASSDLGIPLRLNTDFTEQSTRSNLLQTYNQIISDIKASIPLLPTLPQVFTRPSKLAAYADLSRIYLYMRKYELAGLYADSALQIKGTINNYNTVDSTSTAPFAANKNNDEIITNLVFIDPSGLLTTGNHSIDGKLYGLYSQNDLRRVLFFSANSDGSHSFKGTYGYYNKNTLCSGLTTTEILLIRSECNARAGKIEQSLADINKLLAKRYKTGTSPILTASNAREALNLVLTERRKELVFRGLRWLDMKRLNVEGANIVLSRTVNGTTYTLTPNSNAYTFQIPLDVLKLSGMQPNPR